MLSVVAPFANESVSISNFENAVNQLYLSIGI
jgi:hypothetical protein